MPYPNSAEAMIEVCTRYHYVVNWASLATLPLFSNNEPSDTYRLWSATFCVSVSHNDTQKVSRVAPERLTDAVC
jgi:hypothetical protein